MLCLWSCVVIFFFFKQKTAYEMRISDWSSDVCSSDLPVAGSGRLLRSSLHQALLGRMPAELPNQTRSSLRLPARNSARSEERRVGKECVSTCRSRWSTYH